MEDVTETKKKKKSTSIIERIVIIIAYVLIFIGLLFIGFKLYFKLPHSDYYNASVQAFTIPGTSDGFIAQGIDYDAANEQFLVSGYMKNGSPSPIYIVNKKGNTTKKLFVSLENGKKYRGHGGGIALSGDFVYLTGDDNGSIHVISYPDILSAKSGSSVSVTSALNLVHADDDYIGPAFVSNVGEYLVVGEFYRKDDYPTLPSHKIETDAGDTHRALAVVYRIDASLPEGVDPTPIAAISLPKQVQGLTVSEGRVYLSTSWGLSRSHILTYDAIAAAASRQENDITVLGTTVPLYALDRTSRLTDKEIPPMSEEMVVVNGYLYVMCESASDKYIFGKFTDGEFCYATKLSFFEK